jgi:hypothetical protein
LKDAIENTEKKRVTRARTNEFLRSSSFFSLVFFFDLVFVAQVRAMFCSFQGEQMRSTRSSSSATGLGKKKTRGKNTIVMDDYDYDYDADDDGGEKSYARCSSSSQFSTESKTERFMCHGWER